MLKSSLWWKALGPTDPDIELDSLGTLLLGAFDKSLFSMVTPDVRAVLNARPCIKSIVIFGIEVCFHAFVTPNYANFPTRF
jgi:hypothetical protein